MSASPGNRAEPAPQSGGGQQLKILLVEDHDDTLLVLTRLLRALRHQVRTAMSVRQANEVADAEHFDLVVCDLGLPDGSGLDLMRDLHIRHGLKGLALSGFDVAAEAEQHAAGFLGHIMKPVDLDTLEKTLNDIARQLHSNA